MNNIAVIDASVYLRWILKEKEDISAINGLVKDLSNGNITALAPTLWLYEMLNGLKMAVVRKRIGKIIAKRKISDILETAPSLFEFTPLADNTFLIATKYQLSVYDSSYITLAKQKRCRFYTGDQNLYEKVKRKLKFVLPISEYKGITTSPPQP